MNENSFKMGIEIGQQSPTSSVHCYCQKLLYIPANPASPFSIEGLKYQQSINQVKSHIQNCPQYEGIVYKRVKNVIKQGADDYIAKLFTLQMQVCIDALNKYLTQLQQQKARKAQFTKKEIDLKNHIHKLKNLLDQIQSYGKLLHNTENRKQPPISLQFKEQYPKPVNRKTVSEPNVSSYPNLSNLNAQNNESVMCQICKKKYEQSKIVSLQLCWHKFCVSCLKNYIEKQYVNSKGELACPLKLQGCKCKIQIYQIKGIIGQSKLQQFDRQIIKNTFGLTQCAKCSYQFQLEPTDTKYVPLFGKDMKILTLLQREHYAKNRFICPRKQCMTEQCKLCGQVPYHLGRSCRQKAQKLEKQSRDVIINKQCRYCDSKVPSSNIQNNAKSVCSSERCKILASQACEKMLPCGHSCYGIKGEENCLPCLQSSCSQSRSELKGQRASDNCKLCQNKCLSRQPCVKANCGHIFHENCLKQRYQKRWKLFRINFDFCLCPVCQKWMVFSNLSKLGELSKKNMDLFNKIQSLSVQRLRFQGRNNDRAILNPSSQYFNNEYSYSISLYAFYECFKCKNPYYVGSKNQTQQPSSSVNSLNIKNSQLICPKCCGIGFDNCPKHASRFIQFKCKFCCSLAQFFNASTHYCGNCYKMKELLNNVPIYKLPDCKGKGSEIIGRIGEISIGGCPLGGNHNGNGSQVAISCDACRNSKSNINQ